MCEMMTIATVAGLVIAAGSTAYTYYENDKAVEAQNEFNEKQAQEGAALANEAFKNQANQVNLRTQQEREAAAQELTLNAKKAAEARATARVSAGEAGVSGVSVDHLIMDYQRQELEYASAVNRNQQMGEAQSQEELKGFRSGALDRALAFQRPTINRPSYLAAGADIANQGLATYSRYRYLQSTSPVKDSRGVGSTGTEPWAENTTAQYRAK